MAIYTKTRVCDGIKMYYIRFQLADGRRKRELAGTTKRRRGSLSQRRSTIWDSHSVWTRTTNISSRCSKRLPGRREFS